MDSIKDIGINGSSPLFSTEGLSFTEFPSDYRNIRYFALLIVQNAPPEFKELNLLEQQISELIKNAVKHGNRNDPSKKVRVWHGFDADSARLIVRDEGEGFRQLEEWNSFNRKRLECLHEQNYEKLGDYVSFRTDCSDDTDGGNALFAALEYWNAGFCFDETRTGVAMRRVFC